MLATIEEVHDDAFGYRSRAIENAVAMQGHGVVLVEWPGYNDYPDNAGAAEFFTGELSASRDKVCADWERKATGVIAGINKLCGRDDFDCSSGIALTGGSAGAGVAVQVSKLYPGVNALLSTQWSPLLGAGQPVFEAFTGPGGGPYLLTAAEVRWLPVCRPVRWLRALAAHVHQNPPSPRWTSGRADRRTAYAEFTQDGRGSQLRCALQPKTCNV